MFDIGFLEISVIFVVALIVVGPEKLPGLARTVGLYVGKARRYADFVRREIENEVRTAELKELAQKPPLLDEVKESLTEAADTLKSTEKELQQFVAPASPETVSPETVSPETVSPETVSPETVSPRKESKDTPPRTLGDMARASWSDQSRPEVVEPISTNQNTLESVPGESLAEDPDASTTSSPERTNDDERRDRTT